MAKKKSPSPANKSKNVFYSFDAPDDKVLKDFAVGQTINKSTPFKAEDKSLKKAQPQSKWEKAAEKKISNSDLVMVMLGDKTHKATGVKKEVAMARKHGVQVVQIKPQKSNAKKVTDAGRTYNWTNDNMTKLLKKKK